MIYNFELEKQLLAGLIKDPESYSEIAGFITKDDFYSKDTILHSTIFSIIKQALDKGESIDETIIAQRVVQLSLSFDDKLSPADYIKSLSLRKVPSGNVLNTAKELKKFTIRREIYDTSAEVANRMRHISPEMSYSEIVEAADQLYNSKIDLFDSGEDVPENIYEDMEDIIEERGNNPIENFGHLGPHPMINKIYGSLLRNGNITVIVARSGVGKMNPLTTPVLTPSGFKPMGQIEVGSQVVCPNGNVANVIRTFDHKNKDIYEVEFSDGRKSRCGLEHLWKCFVRDNKGNYNWDVINTEAIIDHLSHPTKKVYIPLVSGEYGSYKLPIKPYSLGCFIGDGSLTGGAVIESADEQIIDRMKDELGLCVSVRNSGKSKSSEYRFIKNGTKNNHVMDSLRELGLLGLRSHEKFIPEACFSMSFEDRVDLVKGMMDTDGTLSASVGRSGLSKKYGSLSYSTSSPQLAKDFQRLVWSIGGIAKITSKKPFYKDGDGNRIYGKTSYRISLKFRDPKSLFFLDRKKDKAPSQSEYQYSDLKLRVISVKKLDHQEDCRCIEIDDSEHLYVVDDFIVTHNTQFCMDYCTKVCDTTGTPVLHFDNGEMSKEELVMRQCAALSGVPMYLLETGKWRKAGQDVVDKVRAVWPRIKHLKFYYYNVGGSDVDSMIKVLRRFYYSKVGRGNEMILSFDYIKTSSEGVGGNKNEYQLVGEIVDKFKRCIQKEIRFEGKPMISMMTSVQSNRMGIVTNRNSQNIVDDESIVSLSDRIIQFSSYMFILRKKTNDEMAAEGRNFGSHKLINIKARHLGEDRMGALEPVVVGDTLRNNFINLDFNNFNITEKGDLREIVKTLDGQFDLDEDDSDESAPRF